MKNKKYIYRFSQDCAEGDKSLINLLGGKGANLAEMTSIGLPVPPGFTITTEVCTYYYDHKNSYPRELAKQIDGAIREVEKTMGASFGDPKNPIFVRKKNR